MATSDSLLDISDGRVRVLFHSDASQLSVAVRSPVTARLRYDTGTSIVINADYTWSGSSMHNIIHQTWTIDYQP